MSPTASLQPTGFKFSGEVQASKSLLNRALVASSYSGDVRIVGNADCDDVRLMRQGLGDLLTGRPVDCGHAGTVLRFLALRASRLPGRHVLKGSERLFSRPQTELLPIFGQLGVDAQFGPSELVIRSSGWRLIVDGLQVNAERSSQFASAVILNAWDLKFPLHFQISRHMVSESYLRMTIELMRQLGMRIEDRGGEFFIPANQYVKAPEYHAEPDVSSVFAVAALALVAGEARVQNFPVRSLQPDVVFVRLLREMGADIDLQASGQASMRSQPVGDLVVRQTKLLRGIRANLEKSPDLLPVLGVLAALASTPSYFEGVGHLKYKESARLEKTRELLEIMGARVITTDATITIEPQPDARPGAAVVFDVDQDHRMAMAAMVARFAGYAVRPSEIEVVKKSFPEFQKLVEGAL